MNREKCREFDDAGFSRFRRKLLRTRGGPEQREFLSVLRDDGEFLRAVRSEVITQGSEDPVLYPEALTESEFKQPPVTTEAGLYGAWSNLAPRIACRTTFWANLTCRHIESGRIHATYLAANGGPGAGGAERIDRVLQEKGATAANQIDRCVRTVLRRLGGLPEARGNKSVYVDCPLARAWWRERLVREVSRGEPDCAEDVRDVTRVNQTYWEELVVLVVSRNSVLGSQEVRDEFIRSLADLMVKEPETPMRIATNLRAACRMVGAIQASRELSVLEEGELRTLMDEVVQLQHRRAGSNDGDG